MEDSFGIDDAERAQETATSLKSMRVLVRPN
jgi:hypothetical protein